MLVESRKNPCILIVDAQDANLLEKILAGAGYRNCVTTQDSREALPLWNKVQPDIVLLDLQTLHPDGYAILAQLSSHVAQGAYVPILGLTAAGIPAAKQKALSLGAADFLTKPYDALEVVPRVQNLLQTRHLHLALRHQNTAWGENVRHSSLELKEVQLEILERLAAASESRDDSTGLHTQRVGKLSEKLAAVAGWPRNELEALRMAAALHDIGKIGIPDRILLKPGRLTQEEFEIMKTHSSLGARILGGSDFPVLQLAEQIARYHHEKWNGSGYNGLAGEEIPFAARIVAIADVFDVLTHSRPYKPAWPLKDALAKIRSEAGHHFDPALASSFLGLIDNSSLDALRATLNSDAEPVFA